jgi:hypothetical protein
MAPGLKHCATLNMYSVGKLHYLAVLNQRKYNQFKKENFMEERNANISGPSYYGAVQ